MSALKYYEMNSGLNDVTLPPSWKQYIEINDCACSQKEKMNRMIKEDAVE
jgi:hypothetical protein